MRYYRDWGPSIPPVRLLCPIDHSSESCSEDVHSKGAEGGGEGEATPMQNRGGARGRPHAQSMRINGRRMLMCNINGMFFQVRTSMCA